MEDIFRLPNFNQDEMPLKNTIESKYHDLIEYLFRSSKSLLSLFRRVPKIVAVSNLLMF